VHLSYLTTATTTTKQERVDIMPGEKKAAAKPKKSAVPQAVEVVLEDSINIVRPP